VTGRHTCLEYFCKFTKIYVFFLFLVKLVFVLLRMFSVSCLYIHTV